MLVAHVLRNRHCVPGRHGYEFCVPAVTMFPDHLALVAELFVAVKAEGTGAARDQVVQASPPSDHGCVGRVAYILNHSGYFVPGDYWDVTDGLVDGK